MHFEILVEDRSGKKMLELLLPQIIDISHNTFKVHSYKGIGNIPKGMNENTDPRKKFLLDQLPGLLNGYGKTFSGYPPNYHAVVVVVCDLDKRCLKEFREELYGVISKCHSQPRAFFCIAIEECEAWYLGDSSAIKRVYPKAKDSVLESYENDSICNTWEKLADAVYPGGSKVLSEKGWQAIGAEKAVWAEKITPHVDVEGNKSPSFQYFRNKLISFAGISK
jgi:hypothetical protein